MTSPAPTTIRPLAAGDAPLYRALRLQALAEAPEAFGASHADESAKPLAAFAERLGLPPPSAVFGAFTDGRLVGTAGFRAQDGEKQRHIGLLWGVYIAPDVRRHGIARALLRELIVHANRHVLILLADVGAANHPARRLYESLGFRCYGLKPKALQVNGAYVDEALLAFDFSAS